ncbi:hypothetical protein VIBNIFTn2_120061 [Vibrio nigripulchritudo FTn2]|uniref:hypothetical protein n=1 Tax=Vibrio nigripulchritudo TaxID=28173 RepID=UPI0003B241F7|nr:hypothetical protein [Vibrio nigripulchritudo]CCN40079.1 hypothetical protein VIBNIFTn2_120061 [Vibrio nigripulchritudo FTn2]
MFLTPSITAQSSHATQLNIQSYLSKEAARINEFEAVLICLLGADNDEKQPDLLLSNMIDDILDRCSEGVECSYAHDLISSMTLTVDGLSDEFENRGAFTLNAEFDFSTIKFKLDPNQSSYGYLTNRLLSAISYSAMTIDTALDYFYVQEKESLPYIFEANVQRDDGKPLTIEDLPESLCYALNEEYGLDPDTILGMVDLAEQYDSAFGENGTHLIYRKDSLEAEHQDLNDPEFVALIEALDDVEAEQKKLHSELQKINDFFHQDTEFAPLHLHTIVTTDSEIEEFLYEQLTSQSSMNAEEVAQTIALKDRADLERYLTITISECCQVAKVIDAYNRYAKSKGLPQCK